MVREFLKFVITKGQLLVRIFAWGKDLIGKLYKKNLPRKKSVRAEENKFSSRGKYFFLATPTKKGRKSILLLATLSYHNRKVFSFFLLDNEAMKISLFEKLITQ